MQMNTNITQDKIKHACLTDQSNKNTAISQCKHTTLMPLRHMSHYTVYVTDYYQQPPVPRPQLTTNIHTSIASVLCQGHESLDQRENSVRKT